MKVISNEFRVGFGRVKILLTKDEVKKFLKHEGRWISNLLNNDTLIHVPKDIAALRIDYGLTASNVLTLKFGLDDRGHN